MSFILSEYMKSFFFVFVVHYFIMLLPVVFFVRLRWVFIKSVFVVGSEAVAICDIIIFKKSWCIIRLYVVFVLRAFLIERLCGLFVVVVFVIDFAVDWWGLVSKKKNKGLTVHCNVAFVKPYVKMSVVWSMRLNFWFWWILFVVKTFSCFERRFASGTS